MLDLQWFFRFFLQRLYCTFPMRTSWRYCWPAPGRRCPSLLTDGKRKTSVQREDHAARHPLKERTGRRKRKSKGDKDEHSAQIYHLCHMCLPLIFLEFMLSLICAPFCLLPASRSHAPTPDTHLQFQYTLTPETTSCSASSVNPFHPCSGRSSSILTSSSFPMFSHVWTDFLFGPLLIFWTVFDRFDCLSFITLCLDLYLVSDFFSCGYGNLNSSEW